MQNIEALNSIGLSKWEAQTYLALLELGETKTGELSRKADVPQAKIYTVLESLIEKGLVSYIIKSQTKHFQASDPKRILTLFKEKEEEVKNLLQNTSRNTTKKNSVELFQGLKAMRIMLASLIEGEIEENLYGFATGKTSENKEISDFYHWWGERKRIANIKDHLLISETNKQNFKATIAKEHLEYVLAKTKFAKIEFPGDTLIFKNKVILFNYENIPNAILITSEDMAKQYREFFLGIWNSIKLKEKVTDSDYHEER